MGRRRKLDSFIKERHDRQRNIVFPNIVRNAGSVDAFLWRGSPHPTIVQRVAAWMIGLTLIGFGIQLFALIFLRASSIADAVFGVVSSLLVVLLGIRTFRNGFPRGAKRGESKGTLIHHPKSPID
jgi:hypothetical protein